MRRLIAVLLVAALLVGLAASAAHAGGTAAKVALGLASFAVFAQLVGPFVYPPPVYAYPPVYVAAPPAEMVYVPPPPPTVIRYPHGRYELRTDGAQYTWVWIPNPPPPPSYAPPSAPTPPPAGPSSLAPCQPTGRYVKTPQGMLPECE